MQSTTRRSKKPGTTSSFDVTCVIGTVIIGPFDEPADVVAMKLIAEHQAPGRFTFPMADGRTQVVTVEHLDPADLMREE